MEVSKIPTAAIPAPAEFVRLWKGRRETINTEICVEWAVAHGYAPLSRYSQLRLWRKHSIEDGAAIMCARMGLKEIDARDAQAGDIGVFIHFNEKTKLTGIYLGESGFAIVAGFGKFYIARYPIHRAWRV